MMMMMLLPVLLSNGNPWSVHASPEQGRCIQLFMYHT
jgi:hypothetical protein